LIIKISDIMPGWLRKSKEKTPEEIAKKEAYDRVLGIGIRPENVCTAGDCNNYITDRHGSSPRCSKGLTIENKLYCEKQSNVEYRHPPIKTN
jgi:hypothetical protein